MYHLMRLLIKLSILCIALAMLAAQASATMAMYEAGKAVICIDEDFEKGDSSISLFDTYPTIYFEPISSREEVKNNEYNLIFTDIGIMDKSNLDVAVVSKPITIMISDLPLDPESLFVFDINPVKNIKIGKLGLVNTTLYNGSWQEQTPHLVAFAEGNFSCCIYGQDIRQKDMEDFLARIDIISKDALSANLPKLWTE